MGGLAYNSLGPLMIGANIVGSALDIFILEIAKKKKKNIRPGGKT
jgi:hypothetical protein